MMNTHWSSIKTIEEDYIVGGAGKEFMVLATVVKNAGGMVLTFIINHVPNYPLGCTILCTQNILLFSFPNIAMLVSKIITNAKPTKKMVVGNTIIVVQVAILTFTSNVLIHRSPWNLKSTTIH